MKASPGSDRASVSRHDIPAGKCRRYGFPSDRIRADWYSATVIEIRLLFQLSEGNDMNATTVGDDLGERRTDDLEMLVFEVDGQRHGVASTAVCEVLPAVTLTPISGASRLVEGIINVRGRVLSVIDVRAWLGLETRPIEPTDHLIVVCVGDRSAVLRVDRAVELIRLTRA